MNYVTRRVTANLPQRLLTQACEVTGRGLTETLVRDLELIKRQSAANKAKRRRGRLVLDIDIDE